MFSLKYSDRIHQRTHLGVVLSDWEDCCCFLVAHSYPTLCDPMDCSMPGLPVYHEVLEFTQTHVHWVGDAIQLSHPLSSPSSAFSLSQHQGLFQWVSSSHQVAKVEHHLWVIIVYNKSRKVRSIILVVEWNTNSLYGGACLLVNSFYTLMYNIKVNIFQR